MRLPRECYQMQQVIETHLPHLSRPQLTGLVLWVCGAVLAGAACQNGVASALSPWGRWNNLRQYPREWLYDGSDRARPCRTELDVSLCFAPLLRWVLSWWRSGRLALAYGARVEDAHDRRIAPGNLRTPPKTPAPRRRDPWGRPVRTVSIIRHGIDWLRRLLLRGRLWSQVWLLPEPWPEPQA